ncbi:MAG: helix-turn-helix domain-containing protein [Actinomycetaceae bacterium]|nr:helix-turn-helix domain-containing protein [Actinomycetaceae bacterium]
MNTESDSTASARCTAIEDVMGVLGKAYAGAILKAALGGATRFSDFKSATGVSDGVLSTRLKELSSRGFFKRQVDPGPPTVVRYVLTAAGQDTKPLLDVIEKLAQTHKEAFQH